jgi:adenosylcobinamide-GDP ribazoletransferase
MKSFMLALQFISRIHIFNVAFEEAAFGKATRFFPLVGLILGAITALLYRVSITVFPLEVTSALAILSMVLLTGGIHLDGFMDSMDGLFSGRDRERKLEIMKDSRIGAFGAVGLVSLFLVKYTVILNLPFDFIYPLLMLAPVISRWSMVIGIKFYPYLREQGLGKLYSQYTGWIEFIFATVLVVLITIFLAGLPGLVMLLLAGLLAFLMYGRVYRQLGGLTGDIYGAVNEITEVIVLLLSYPVLQYIPHILIGF